MSQIIISTVLIKDAIKAKGAFTSKERKNSQLSQKRNLLFSFFFSVKVDFGVFRRASELNFDFVHFIHVHNH